MTIATTDYRPKRASPKRRKQPPLAQVIVTPAPMKKGPPRHVTRLKTSVFAGQEQPRPVAIVTPQRKPKPSVFGAAPDMTPEEHQRVGDLADQLFRDMVRRAREASD